MEALFFEGDAGALFGILTPAEGAFVRPTALVVCPPFGQEGLIAHQAIRQLALLAARNGINVFRFDYFGTGDSAGVDETFTLDQARKDTLRAIHEALDLTGASHVALIGLRLGAVVAARAAARESNVAAVTLWDPVVSGPAYVAEMLTDIAKHSPIADGLPILPGEKTFGFDGFPVSPQLYAQLQAIDLPVDVDELTMPVHLLHSSQPDCSVLANRPPVNLVAEADSLPLWTRAPGAGNSTVSMEAINQIIHWHTVEVS